IAGIMIVDYWWLRRGELDVADLYRHGGRYGGVRLPALGALILGVAPNLPGFLKSTHVIIGADSLWDALYPYAWFTGFGLGGLAYALLAPRASAPPGTPASLTFPRA